MIPLDCDQKTFSVTISESYMSDEEYVKKYIKIPIEAPFANLKDDSDYIFDSIDSTIVKINPRVKINTDTEVGLFIQLPSCVPEDCRFELRVGRAELNDLTEYANFEQVCT